MKRSEVNNAVRQASAFFEQHHWALPPQPRWDVTDFGLGQFEQSGLVLINLAEEPEYCEKLMYARRNQLTPAHCHHNKKEDIICRNGQLAVRVWMGDPREAVAGASFQVQVNGRKRLVENGETVVLNSGERITLVPHIYHEFWPQTEECVIGEVSTANDDLNDNFFINPDIGRYSQIDEDEAPLVRLVSDKN